MSSSFPSNNFSRVLETLETQARELERMTQNPAACGNDLKERISRVSAILQTARSNIDKYGPVTPEMIRETFYNVCAGSLSEKVNQGLIARNDVQEMASYVILALPALVILKILKISQDVEGIKLINERIVTANNCPEEFKPIYSSFNTPVSIQDNPLSVKERIKQLSEAQFKDLEVACVDDPAKPLSANCPDRARLMALAAHIKRAATAITQKAIFKNLATDVMEVGLAL